MCLFYESEICQDLSSICMRLIRLEILIEFNFQIYHIVYNSIGKKERNGINNKTDGMISNFLNNLYK